MKVTLSDGTVIDILSFGISGSGYMFIRVPMDIGQAYAAFIGKTGTIQFSDGETDRTYRGFSKLEYIVNETNCVRIALTRPIEEV